jgi:hypothetical protein
LGHYIADAHMPLHTSDNHDGQLTDQRNSLCGKVDYQNYLLNFTVAPARYYEDVKATWDLIMDTHSLVEPLLAADKGLRTALAVNQIFVTDADGNGQNKYNGVKYSNEYAANFTLH